jgi:hypothetical protein
MPTPDSPWMSREPGIREAFVELGRLGRRAAGLPVRILLGSLLLALLVVGFVVLKGHRFGPRYLLRVVESDRAASEAPHGKRALRDHVLHNTFSNGRLLEIIRRNGLYPALARRDPNAAVNSFREDIEVEVYRNYFVEERSPEEPPRSARIAVRFRSEDRALALAVTRELGGLIVEHEGIARRQQAQAAVRDTNSALERMRDEFQSRQKRMTERLLAVESRKDPGAMLELVDLGDGLEAIGGRLGELEKTSAALEVGAAFEQRSAGLRFEVIEQGGVPGSEGMDTKDALGLGMLTFVFGLPLVGLGIAAFDTKLRSGEDLNRLGLRTLGRLRGRERRRAKAARRPAPIRGRA